MAYKETFLYAAVVKYIANVKRNVFSVRRIFLVNCNFFTVTIKFMIYALYED